MCVFYDHGGHVVTDDLAIITDAKLRALIAKGPAYRQKT